MKAHGKTYTEKDIKSDSAESQTKTVNKLRNINILEYREEAIDKLVDKRALFQSMRSLINRDFMIKHLRDTNKLQENTPTNLFQEVKNKWVAKYGQLNYVTKGELRELLNVQGTGNRFILPEEEYKDDENDHDEGNLNENQMNLENMKGNYMYDSRILYGQSLFRSLNEFSDKGNFFVNPILPFLPSMLLYSSQTHSPLSKMISIAPLLISCYENGLVNIFKNNQLIYSYNLHNSEIKDCEVSDCRQYICSTDRSGKIVLVKIGCNVDAEIHYCRYFEYYTPIDNSSEKGKKNMKLPYISFRLDELVEAVVWCGCNLILVDIKGVIRKYAIEEICRFQYPQISDEEDVMTAPLTLHPFSRYEISTKIVQNPQVSVISISNCHRYLFLGGNWSGILIYDMLDNYITDVDHDKLIFKNNTVSISGKTYDLIEPKFDVLDTTNKKIKPNQYMFISCDRVVDMMYHPKKDSIIVATTGEVFDLAFSEISGSKRVTTINLTHQQLKSLKINPDNMHATIAKSIKITEQAITMDTRGTDLPQNYLKNKNFNGAWERRDIVGYNFHENFITFDDFEIPDELPYIVRTLVSHDHILLLLSNSRLMIEHKWCQCLNNRKDFNRSMYVPIWVGAACLIEVHPQKRLIVVADYDVRFYDFYGKQVFHLDFECIYKFRNDVITAESEDRSGNFTYRKGNEYKITEVMFNELGDELYVEDEMGYITVYSISLSEFNDVRQPRIDKDGKKKNKKVKEIYDDKFEIKSEKRNSLIHVNILNKKGTLLADQNFTFTGSFTESTMEMNNTQNLKNMEYICGYVEIGNSYENHKKEKVDGVEYEISRPVKEDNRPTNVFRTKFEDTFDDFITDSTPKCFDCSRNSILENKKIKVPLKVRGDFNYEVQQIPYDNSIMKPHLINRHNRNSFKVLHYLKYSEDNLKKVHEYWSNYYEAMDQSVNDTTHENIESSVTETGHHKNTKEISEIDSEEMESSYVDMTETEDDRVKRRKKQYNFSRKNINISDLSTFDGTSLSTSFSEESSIDNFVVDVCSGDE